MKFLCQAAFWCAVVAAFMPRELSAGEPSARPAVDRAPVVDAEASMARFCGDRPEVCGAGAEAFSLAREAGLYVAERAVDLLSDSQSAS